MVENAFAAGGIEAVTAPLGTEPDAIGAALAEAGTDLACLCGIDRKVPDEAAAMVQALLASGAIAVYAAGSPDPALTSLGIDGFLHEGMNLMGLLEDVQSLAM